MFIRRFRKSKLQDSSMQKTPAHRPIDFDTTFYREYYQDLSQMTDDELLSHWLSFGQKEGRVASESSLYQQEKILNLIEINELDYEFYLTLYPDLSRNGINSKWRAKIHYAQSGKQERRSPSYLGWLKQKKLSRKIFNTVLISDLVQATINNTSKISLQQLLDCISTERVLPLKITNNNQTTSAVYRHIAEQHIKSKQFDRAISLLKNALIFNQDASNYELIADAHIMLYKKLNNNLTLIQSAINYYLESAKRSTENNTGLMKYIKYQMRLNQHGTALKNAISLLTKIAHKTKIVDLLDKCTQDYFNNFHAQLTLLCDSNQRLELLSATKEYADLVYLSYLNSYYQKKHPPLNKKLNTDRILIIGDFHVPQCVRYRIEQKVEQLKQQGKKVKAIDWMKLKKHQNTIALYDIVIFYRVPAVPSILKAMAQVNASGKLSIYEIDDLLFDPKYPAPIESYGGYIGLNTYQSLMKQMALFNSAAQYCRIGIASTIPLAEKLKGLVFENHCIVHRNGLDSLNWFSSKTHTANNTITLFYGSGTQAHNDDFITLALPALTKILSENKHTRLTIAGYLILPNDFLTQFKQQLIQIPAMSNVQNYWRALEQANINLAVLYSDDINDCKSELKWFEAACFDIPSVVSDTKNYRDIVRHDEDGYIAKTTDDWYRYLTLLIQNPQQRTKIATAAKNRIQIEYSNAHLGKQLTHKLESYLLEKKELKTSRQRRKVAIVNVFFSPQSLGGATRVVEDNVQVMIDRYQDDYDFCIFTADAEPRKQSHQLTSYLYHGIPVYRASTLWRVNMDWHPTDPKMYDLFTQFLEHEQPDLIHFHCVQRLTASIVEAARDANIPYLVTVHDAWWISDYQFLVDPQGKVYPEGHQNLYELLTLPAGISLDASIDRRYYLKSLLQDAKQVLTVSEAFADIYRKNGIEHIAVTRNGISQHIHWQPKQTQYTDRVVCALIGGMSAHKGYDILKQAVLQTQPSHLCFLIVDHAKESNYRQEHFWGNVSVTFIGKIKQADIVALYQQIDVLFAPSIWPESFGLVTREAAACGCWIVASNRGGIGEDVVENENGHIIEPTEAALIDVLKKIDQNDKHYKNMPKTLPIRNAEEQVIEVLEYYK